MAEQSVNGGRFTESIVLDDEAERGRLRGLKAFLRLLGYVRHDRPRVALVFGTMLSYTGTLVAIPWTIKLIIDGYIVRPGADLSGLDRLIAVFGLIVLLHYLSDYFYRRTQVVLGNRVLYALRVQLFAHMLRLSMRFYDRNQTGRVMSRVQNDVQQLQELLNIWLFAVANLVGLLGVTVAMLVMSLQLALITFASVLLIIPVLMLWQRYARLSFLRARQTIPARATDHRRRQRQASGESIGHSGHSKPEAGKGHHRGVSRVQSGEPGGKPPGNEVLGIPVPVRRGAERGRPCAGGVLRGRHGAAGLP